MAAFFYGSLVFAFSLALHVCLWRIRVPKRQTKTLLMLFFGVLAAGSGILGLYPEQICIFNLRPPVSAVDYVQIWLYVGSLILAYMITYSAVEADSPSLSIILLIHAAGPSGLATEQIEKQLDDKILVEPRIRDLLIDEMAEEDRGCYRLKTKGILMARLFSAYRRIMGVGKGG